MQACTAHHSPAGPPLQHSARPPIGLPFVQAGEGLAGCGGCGEWDRATSAPMSHSSSSSAERQTLVLRGAPGPAQRGPPAQPQRDGDADGLASRGGARRAHPGTAVHHCSLTKVINKCLGRSLGAARLLWACLGKMEWKGRDPARVQVAGLQLLDRSDLQPENETMTPPPNR